MTLILSGTDGLSDIDGSVSTPAIRGTDANTGVYFPGADRLGFSTGGVQRGEFDASGNFLMNSGYGSVATAYGCRAWVNFNGTGTVAIRASGNVTSITDNGTGDYTVNFTTAMPDSNYAVLGTSNTHAPAGAFDGVQTVTYSTTSIRITTTAYEGSEQDVTQVNIAVLR
jgi:hypothetical protein